MSHFDSEITMNDQLLEYHAKSNAIIPAENKVSIHYDNIFF